MRRAIFALALLLVGAAAGAWIPNFVASQSGEGSNAQCIRVHGRSVCRGQSVATLTASFTEMGGITDLQCGWQENDNTWKFQIPDIVGGCKGPRYVVGLSDGVLRTTLWIDNGRIARIGRESAHPIES